MTQGDKAEWLVWRSQEEFTYKKTGYGNKTYLLKQRKGPQCPFYTPHTPTPSTSLEFILREVEKMNVTVEGSVCFF